MAQTYNIISIAAFSLAGVFLILAVFFWFRYGIKKIIGDLSGYTAKKSIADMRNSEKNQSKKFYTPLSPEGGSGDIKLNSVGSATTEQLKNKNTAVNDLGSEDTELLAHTDDLGSGVTELLDAGDDLTGNFDDVSYETDILRDDTELPETGLFEETELLEDVEDRTALPETDTEFVVTKSIIYIHTNEVI